MKVGKEIGLLPIRLENKIGCEELRKIHFKINDLLYDHCTRLISYDCASILSDAFCEIGIELKALEVPNKAEPKKNELLAKLREKVLLLRKYKNSTDSIATKTDNSRIYKRCLAKYMRIKDQESLELYIECLQENLKAYHNGLYGADHATLRELRTLQEEIVDQIGKLFKIP